MENYIVPFFIALLLSFVATPFVRKLAFKIGAVDVPKDDRRVHKKPMPRLGGLAIYFGSMTTLFIYYMLNKFVVDTHVIAIVVGATIIVATGVVDDRTPIKAKTKLFWQIVAAVVLVMGDVRIAFLTNPFGSEEALIYLNILAIPATIIWVIGITNTLNLIDGLDGLSAGVGGIAAVSMFFIASQLVGNSPVYPIVMLMAAVLAGATFGFLPYNFNPAKIFMGDTGSLFLGYMLAVISIRGALKSVTAFSIILPVMILGIPIFDTAFAIVRRKLNNKPISEADRGHVHHRLLDRGLSQRQTVSILYIISIMLGSVAVFLTDRDNYMYMAIATVSTIMTFFVLSKIGVIDFKRIQKRRITDRETE